MHRRIGIFLRRRRHLIPRVRLDSAAFDFMSRKSHRWLKPNGPCRFFLLLVMGHFVMV
jgi:hypothetical protein